MSYGFNDSFNITGLVELQTKLSAFGDKVINVVTQKALMEGAKVIQAQARINAKSIGNTKKHWLKISDTYELLNPGNLSKNIRIRRVKKVERGFKSAQVYVKLKRAWYAKFVEGTETGTSRQAANPFMRPAFEDKKEEAVTIFKQYIEDAIVGGNL